VAQELARASGYKDLRENAEWDAALELQSSLKHEASEIIRKINNVELIETLPITGDRVTIGTQIKIFDVDQDTELNYKILGEEESDLANGVISASAPLTRGLMQKEEGDEVTVQLPGGKRTFEILSIEKIDFFRKI
jgi:transcription elongation factor GreA